MMIFFLGLALVSVLITGISQVLLKIGAQNGKENKGVLSPYLNLPALTAYGLLLFVSVIAVIALIGIPLKLLCAISSLNFVVVLILSRIILKEKIDSVKIYAVFLIVVGVLIFYSAQ